MRFDQHSQNIDEDSMRFTASFLSDKSRQTQSHRMELVLNFHRCMNIYVYAANSNSLPFERGTSDDF